MEQWKNAKVLMLPTKEKSNFIVSNNKIYFFTDAIGTPSESKHLYITSDDEIKEGDWCIFNNHIIKYNKPSNPHFYKKIIATTDTSLRNFEGTVSTYIGNSLPQPSQQFIEMFVKWYNKDEVITDVLVECEEYFDNDKVSKLNIAEYCSDDYHKLTISSKLKINPKDNTITIKSIKDNWNRENLHKLAEYFYKIGMARGRGNLEDRIDCNKSRIDEYINKNL